MIQVQSLRDSIDNIKPEVLREVFARFKCPKDEDIEKFLLNYAIEYEENNVSRTFFVLDSEVPGEIIGYFSIGLNVMYFEEKIAVGEAYQGINLYENGFRPIYKLFMIGKNSLYDKSVCMKDVFFNTTIPYLKIAQQYIGGDLLYIDCEPQLRGYYEGLGFTYYDDQDHNLIRMIRKL